MQLLKPSALVSVAMLIVITTNLAAQDGFSSRLGQQLHASDRIRVTVARVRIKGTFVELTAEGLSMAIDGNRSTFQCAQIERVEKRGDPVWNGAVVGAIIIALPAWNACNNKARNLPCVMLAMGTYAAIGAAFDKAHQGWHTVYVASRDSCRTLPH